jgi:hypothetical protein
MEFNAWRYRHCWSGNNLLIWHHAYFSPAAVAPAHVNPAAVALARANHVAIAPAPVISNHIVETEQSKMVCKIIKKGQEGEEDKSIGFAHRWRLRSKLSGTHFEQYAVFALLHQIAYITLLRTPTSPQTSPPTNPPMRPPTGKRK